MDINKYLTPYDPVFGKLMKVLGVDLVEGIIEMDIRVRLDEVVTITIKKYADGFPITALDEIETELSVYQLVKKDDHGS